MMQCCGAGCRTHAFAHPHHAEEKGTKLGAFLAPRRCLRQAVLNPQQQGKRCSATRFDRASGYDSTDESEFYEVFEDFMSTDEEDEDTFRSIWEEEVTGDPSTLDPNIWVSKPPWCQPWTILLTGSVAPLAVYGISKNEVIAAPFSVLVLSWWWVFLIVMPFSYRQYVEDLQEQN